MNSKKIRKIKETIEALRGKGGIKSKELEAVARMVGRTPHARGKEPAWISSEFPDLRPVSIPHHSKEPNRYTANNILNQLEEDLIRHEDKINN